MSSIGITVRFTLPMKQRHWFINRWCNRWYDCGFAGVRILGIDLQLDWWGVPIFPKQRPTITTLEEE